MSIVRVFHSSNYRVTDWSGGRTTELAIAPVGSLYAERKFLWRFSTATAEVEESTYTSLPDYNRVILSLRGLLRLSHDDTTWRDFAEFEPYAFDGGVTTQARGKVVDLNLMLRKAVHRDDDLHRGRPRPEDGRDGGAGRRAAGSGGAAHLLL